MENDLHPGASETSCRMGDAERAYHLAGGFLFGDRLIDQCIN
ncbi:MAG: hypothetical protein SGI77_05740 [Pirellulaceae bacterium]|nr:hypothetical protein [Pirellulaceae bacterium]